MTDQVWRACDEPSDHPFSFFRDSHRNSKDLDSKGNPIIDLVTVLVNEQLYVHKNTGRGKKKGISVFRTQGACESEYNRKQPAPPTTSTYYFCHQSDFEEFPILQIRWDDEHGDPASKHGVIQVIQHIPYNELVTLLCQLPSTRFSNSGRVDRAGDGEAREPVL